MYYLELSRKPSFIYNIFLLFYTFHFTFFIILVPRPRFASTVRCLCRRHAEIHLSNSQIASFLKVSLSLSLFFLSLALSPTFFFNYVCTSRLVSTMFLLPHCVLSSSISLGFFFSTLHFVFLHPLFMWILSNLLQRIIHTVNISHRLDEMFFYQRNTREVFAHLWIPPLSPTSFSLVSPIHYTSLVYTLSFHLLLKGARNVPKKKKKKKKLLRSCCWCCCS